jgi:putative hydrolase of the HAD superfamily
VPTLIFDADDTLWENNVHFERVAAGFFAWLAHPDDAHARAVHREVEQATVRTHGYGTASFLRTLHDTVERLRDRPPTAAERAEVDAMAAVLARHEVELVPGADEVLTALGRGHDLRLLTKGQVAEQQAKIDASGLAGHFTSTHIVAEKTVATYRGLVDELSLRPERTWMIGNSPRSDILPARAAGLHAVHVPHPSTWLHEHAEITDPAVVTVASLRDLTSVFNAT